MTLRVLHVIPSLAPELGGPTEVVLNLTRALRAEGIDAEIATTDDFGRSVLDVERNARVLYEGVPTWFFARAAFRYHQYIPSLPFARWLLSSVKNYDVLDHHYLFTFTSTWAARVAQSKNVPYVTRTMGQLSPWSLAYRPHRKSIYARLFERRNLDLSAEIHCTTAAEAEDVAGFGAKAPIALMPLGVMPLDSLPGARDLLRRNLGIDRESCVVLFLSRLHEKKRPEQLIEVFADIVRETTGVHLILAGSGAPSYEAKLRELARGAGLDASSVTFSGFVSGVDKALLLRGSDIFVLNSHSENFGIAVAEAMAAGLPVVLGRGVQLAREVLQAEAGVIIEGDREELRLALRTLIAAPQLRRAMGAAGARYAAQQFSWSRIARLTAERYQAILDRGNVSRIVF